MTHRPYIPPQAPLHSDYAPPGPPSAAVPGTPDAKSKAGHILISVASTAGCIAVWQMDGPIRWLLLPLVLGAAWPFLPMLADWLIVCHLKRHSESYTYAHDTIVDSLAEYSADHSAKHNSTRRKIDRVVLRTPDADALRAELALLQRRADQPTQRLDRLTADMRRVVTIALGNEARIVSDNRAKTAGMTPRAYLAARDSLLTAGILYRADNGYIYLAPGITAQSIEERLAA